MDIARWLGGTIHHPAHDRAILEKEEEHAEDMATPSPTSASEKQAVGSSSPNPPEFSTRYRGRSGAVRGFWSL
jgi:hypothetical protein